ncbi:MAG: hypothetical protein KDA47_17770 [Planctomycetales bacterium]|nr:hypothetical protein [Planctomycetales bacterium]
MDRYPAKYTDAHGTEGTCITNDGETLRMTVRGVEFAATDFDSLEPSEDTAADQLHSFSLHRGELCSCRIECEMQIPIHDNGVDLTGTLAIVLQLGDPTPNSGLDREQLSVVLNYNERTIAGSGKGGWFEDELIEIQKGLPDGVYVRACINCLYSDYSPYGHGLFGCMMCFRNLKEEYLKVTSKDEFWLLYDRYDRLVQETYLCPDFKRRIPGIGYRG